MISLPTALPTARLTLRGLRSGDERGVYELLSDTRVIRYMLFPRFTMEQAKSFVARSRNEPSGDGPRQVMFGITLSESSDLVGLCGLVVDAVLPTAEAWYLLSPEHWGRGYVTEAVRELVSLGFGALGLHRIWASCLPENPGSSRVLEKLGFRHEGSHRANLLIHGAWRDSHTYAVLESEWSTGGSA
jgi:ribosomal-protein-alanine N-acetyltransferase